MQWIIEHKPYWHSKNNFGSRWSFSQRAETSRLSPVSPKPPQPTPKPPQPPKPNTAKQNFCFYTSWAGGASSVLGLSTLAMSGGSGILELGLGTVVGSLATTSALATAGPALLVGGLALWGVR